MLQACKDLKPALFPRRLIFALGSEVSAFVPALTPFLNNPFANPLVPNFAPNLTIFTIILPPF